MNVVDHVTRLVRRRVDVDPSIHSRAHSRLPDFLHNQVPGMRYLCT